MSKNYNRFNIAARAASLNKSEVKNAKPADVRYLKVTPENIVHEGGRMVIRGPVYRTSEAIKNARFVEYMRACREAGLSLDTAFNMLYDEAMSRPTSALRVPAIFDRELTAARLDRRANEYEDSGEVDRLVAEEPEMEMVEKLARKSIWPQVRRLTDPREMAKLETLPRGASQAWNRVLASLIGLQGDMSAVEVKQNIEKAMSDEGFVFGAGGDLTWTRQANSHALVNAKHALKRVRGATLDKIEWMDSVYEANNRKPKQVKPIAHFISVKPDSIPSEERGWLAWDEHYAYLKNRVNDTDISRVALAKNKARKGKIQATKREVRPLTLAEAASRILDRIKNKVEREDARRRIGEFINGRSDVLDLLGETISITFEGGQPDTFAEYARRVLPGARVMIPSTQIAKATKNVAIGETKLRVPRSERLDYARESIRGLNMQLAAYRENIRDKQSTSKLTGMLATRAMYKPEYGALWPSKGQREPDALWELFDSFVRLYAPVMTKVVTGRRGDPEWNEAVKQALSWVKFGNCYQLTSAALEAKKMRVPSRDEIEVALLRGGVEWNPGPITDFEQQVNNWWNKMRITTGYSSDVRYAADGVAHLRKWICTWNEDGEVLVTLTASTRSQGRTQLNVRVYDMLRDYEDAQLGRSQVQLSEEQNVIMARLMRKLGGDRGVAITKLDAVPKSSSSSAASDASTQPPTPIAASSSSEEPAMTRADANISPPAPPPPAPSIIPSKKWSEAIAQKFPGVVLATHIVDQSLKYKLHPLYKEAIAVLSLPFVIYGLVVGFITFVRACFLCIAMSQAYSFVVNIKDKSFVFATINAVRFGFAAAASAPLSRWLIQMLLLMAGIEPNPGPPKHDGRPGAHRRAAAAAADDAPQNIEEAEEEEMVLTIALNDQMVTAEQDAENKRLQAQKMSLKNIVPDEVRRVESKTFIWASRGSKSTDDAHDVVPYEDVDPVYLSWASGNDIRPPADFKYAWSGLTLPERVTWGLLLILATCIGVVYDWYAAMLGWTQVMPWVNKFFYGDGAYTRPIPREGMKIHRFSVEVEDTNDERAHDVRPVHMRTIDLKLHSRKAEYIWDTLVLPGESHCVEEQQYTARAYLTDLTQVPSNATLWMLGSWLWYVVTGNVAMIPAFERTAMDEFDINLASEALSHGLVNAMKASSMNIGRVAHVNYDALAGLNHGMQAAPYLLAVQSSAKFKFGAAGIARALNN